MKNVIITGAGGILGRSCVEEFIHKGHNVIAVLSPGKKLEYETKRSITVVNADLSDETSADQMVDQVITKHKTIDVALLLVGGFAMGSIHETQVPQIKKMLTLNFETAYCAARKIFMQMESQQQGGRLVFVGAQPALNASAARSKVAYALSKTLVFKLAEILNVAGADKNIVSTVIVPSIIDTPDNRSAMPDADTGKWVRAEEIAAIVEFATSEKSAALRQPILKIYGGS